MHLIIIGSCLRFINDVLKEEVILQQLSKPANILLRFVFGLLAGISAYKIVFYTGITIPVFVGNISLAAFTYGVLHFSHVLFKLIPDKHVRSKTSSARAR